MSIRKDILTALAEVMPQGVKHVALYNNNMAYAEDEQVWARPAVFVEFGNMELRPTKQRCYHAKGSIVLHIIDDYTADGAIFDVTDAVAAVVEGLRGDKWATTGITNVTTDVNHGDLIEDTIEIGFSAEVSAD